MASQQNLHFQQWIKVIELLGYDWAKDCVHVPFGLVSMEEGTMSTRQGRVIFLEDVLNRAVEQTRQIIKEKNVNTENIDETAKEVGIGAVVFNELSNYRIKDYVGNADSAVKPQRIYSCRNRTFRCEVYHFGKRTQAHVADLRTA